MANRALVLVGPPVMLFWGHAVPLVLLWAATWTLAIPLPVILLAVHFRRETRGVA